LARQCCAACTVVWSTPKQLAWRCGALQICPLASKQYTRGAVLFADAPSLPDHSVHSLGSWLVLASMMTRRERIGTASRPKHSVRNGSKYRLCCSHVLQRDVTHATSSSSRRGGMPSAGCLYGILREHLVTCAWGKCAEVRLVPTKRPSPSSL
jgi:hypothetical protein